MTRSRALAASFLGMIALPAMLSVAGFDGGQTTVENRRLAAFPRVDGTWDSLIRVPRRFKKWFEDHFALRSTLVRWHSELLYFGLGVSPAGGVEKGRNGWLFYRGDGAMEDYAREKLLRPDELAAWTGSVAGTERWLHERGVGFVFVIAPDKHVIYPEMLPASIQPVGQRYRTDQVLDALRETDVVAVDVRPWLLASKSRERLYEKTDTHWNDCGAFVAYRQIVAAARAQVASVPPAWSRSDFDAVTSDEPGLDLARLMGLEDVVREQRVHLVPRRPRLARIVEPADGSLAVVGGRVVTEIPGSTLPHVVVFRDSFSTALISFLSEHFGRAVYLWQHDFDPAVVEQERPALVIHEVVGRYLRHVPGASAGTE